MQLISNTNTMTPSNYFNGGCPIGSTLLIPLWPFPRDLLLLIWIADLHYMVHAHPPIYTQNQYKTFVARVVSKETMPLGPFIQIPPQISQLFHPSQNLSFTPCLRAL